MNFLVFQHLDVEHPGIFRDFMKSKGINWDTINWDRGETPDSKVWNPGRYEAMLVMGGPMDVWEESQYPWLLGEKAAIRKWVSELGRPYLGVCLGHQLLADALGGSVGLMARPEVGLGSVKLEAAARKDPLFAGIETPLSCVQWHGAEVKSLPPNTTVLASNEYSPFQSMRHGSNAYGIQFHVEVTATTVAEWNAIPAYCASLEKVAGAGASEKLDRAVKDNLSSLHANALRFFEGFMRVIRPNASENLEFQPIHIVGDDDLAPQA
ncbi:MAG: type 1 glutamine amidotransferase [Pseudolabrys sp.]|nr:type 1 glutamine amidotransferase [Pseudolabrys sp.]